MPDVRTQVFLGFLYWVRPFSGFHHRREFRLWVLVPRIEVVVVYSGSDQLKTGCQQVYLADGSTYPSPSPFSLSRNLAAALERIIIRESPRILLDRFPWCLFHRFQDWLILFFTLLLDLDSVLQRAGTSSF
jgi:hypothetical protein